MWRVFPAVLSLALLGAHFFRAGLQVPVLLCLVLVVLLAVPRPWAARLVQAALVLGAVEWIRTLVTLAEVRAAMGQPATRMAIILGAVALVTLASALVFRHGRVAGFYRLRARAE
jgi:uncharacterized membrane protein YecN with MAPEG domain